jgi:hypothetical protein
VAVIMPEAGQSTIACLLETVPHSTISKRMYLPPATRALKHQELRIVTCKMVAARHW